jgi:heme A synthase
LAYIAFGFLIAGIISIFRSKRRRRTTLYALSAFLAVAILNALLGVTLSIFLQDPTAWFDVEQVLVPIATLAGAIMFGVVAFVHSQKTRPRGTTIENSN